MIARMQSWVKITYKNSKKTISRAYIKGAAELQESWRVDSGCRFAAACLKWYECEALRETCGLADAYHEWGDCTVLEAPPNGNEVCRAARTKLKALARIEYEVGQEWHRERYQALVRRFLAVKLQRTLWWWNHQVTDTERSARRIRESVGLDIAIRLLEQLDGREQIVARLATEGNSINDIAKQCGNGMTEPVVRGILGAIAGRRTVLDVLRGNRDAKFSRLTECWER